MVVMNKKLFILLLFSFLSLNSSALRGSYYGQPGDYLRHGVGARALAMGGAYSALADDGTASYWNPASLSLVNSYEVHSMHAPYFFDTNLNYLSYVHPFGRNFKVALANTLLYSGGYEKRNVLNERLDSGLYIMKNTTVLSAAYNFRDIAGRNSELRKLSVGANYKLVQENIMDYNDSSHGVDLGFIYRPFEMLNVGLSLQNVIQPNIVLVSDENKYKTNVKFGTSLRVLNDNLVLNMDLNKLRDQDAYFSAGAEYNILDRVFARAGFNHLQEPTYGVGIKDNTLIPFEFNYAFSSHKLGSLHRVGLTFKLGNIYQSGVSPRLDRSSEYELKGLENKIEFALSYASFDVKEWSFIIYDGENNPVNSFGGRTRPPEVIEWDLTDRHGRPILPGRYSYVFDVRYDDDESWVSDGNVNIKFPDFRGRESDDMEAIISSD